MINQHTIKTRAFELKKDDRFIMLGYEYIVKRVDDKIYYTPMSSKYHGSQGPRVMGARSKQLILLIINPPDISVPIPFELLKYKSNNNGKR